VGLAAPSGEMLAADLLDASFRRIASTYDPKNGGFGSAPKFPPAMTLEFFMHMHHRNGSKEALEMIENTCRKMAEGGMYDQLGGGFHRYSVDAKWLVPHFEKMLYDNALLSRVYLHFYQLTKDEFARRIAEETLDYVVREMTDAAGGFYSTQDADSEGEEGKFFVWAKDEVIKALGSREAGIFADYFDVTDEGNFEGHNILHISATLDEVAARGNVTVDEARAILDRGRQQLFQIREQRIKPGRDEKVLTAWNGLMLASFAEGAAILDRDDYRKVAEVNADFLLANLYRDGLLLRIWKAGEAKLNGYLEDYACLIEGLICLFEATGRVRWLEQAVALTNKMIAEFWDDQDGGFFFTGGSHEELIVRSKDFLDNATPSGNSVAAFGLQKLAVLTNNEQYQRYATTILRLIGDQIRRYPSAFGWALSALDFYLSTPKEIVVVAPTPGQEVDEFIGAAWERYLPNRVICSCIGDCSAAQKMVPLFEGRVPASKPTGYVCQAYTCQAPAKTPSELLQQLTNSR
jgi:uncharacterized protein YyaL (SSP411 family)